jgi:hypothetical protein
VGIDIWTERPERSTGGPVTAVVAPLSSSDNWKTLSKKDARFNLPFPAAEKSRFTRNKKL